MASNPLSKVESASLTRCRRCRRMPLSAVAGGSVAISGHLSSPAVMAPRSGFWPMSSTCLIRGSLPSDQGIPPEIRRLTPITAPRDAMRGRSGVLRPVPCRTPPTRFARGAYCQARPKGVRARVKIIMLKKVNPKPEPTAEADLRNVRPRTAQRPQALDSRLHRDQDPRSGGLPGPPIPLGMLRGDPPQAAVGRPDPRLSRLGKSFLSALDTHLTSRWDPDHGTRILGGSKAQSEQIYHALRDIACRCQGKKGGDADVIAKLRKDGATYLNGSEVEILAASSHQRPRAPRPQPQARRGRRDRHRHPRIGPGDVHGT